MQARRFPQEEGPPNAGLFTYRVPQESIKIGDVFDQVQARKDEVDLVDYSIAQPSLEAVFIRTVLDYLPLPNASGARMWRFGLGPLEGFPPPRGPKLGMFKFRSSCRRSPPPVNLNTVHT